MHRVPNALQGTQIKYLENRHPIWALAGLSKGSLSPSVQSMGIALQSIFWIKGRNRRQGKEGIQVILGGINMGKQRDKRIIRIAVM